MRKLVACVRGCGREERFKPWTVQAGENVCAVCQEREFLMGYDQHRALRDGLGDLLAALDAAGALNIYLHTEKFRTREDKTSAAIRKAAGLVKFDLSRYDHSKWGDA